tara:strand:+ start:26657 stop:26986 length:330 start_codon:yes stop_codon:yes gene_type:complete
MLYTRHATAVGGRNGHACSTVDLAEVPLFTLGEWGGQGKCATPPEQLFAAGYTASLENALRHVAQASRHAITESSVTAALSIGPRDEVHRVCPYSIAADRIFDVTLTVF